MRALLGLFWVAASVLSGCASTPADPAPSDPEQIFVVAANPLAADAGMNVLRRGGSAVDAAIAVEAMLSLVEPQSSGIGGGGFMTHYDSATRQVTVYDGRETAPAGATPHMFLDAQGNPLPFGEAVVSGRATGVPGVVRMLAMAHRAHGRLPWSGLFGDSIHSASEGFIVSPRLERMVTGRYPQNSTPDVRAYFTERDGTLVDAGDRLMNPAYAAFLRRLAAEGPDALYRGATAQHIVDRVRTGARPGTMTLADLAGYVAIEREPLCRPYRIYILCVPPPPSSGVALLQLMGMLEHTDIARRGPADPQAWFLFAEASRLMYADRDLYVGDPMFVTVPVQGLLDPAYIASRAALIGETAGPPPVAGTPPFAIMPGPDSTREPSGTTHFVVGDAQGNVVSMTATVESIFGSGRMVDGFFLNNQMTDFSFAPRDAQGRAVANAVAAGKRPRSSMTPAVMLYRDRRLAGALGSPGGNAILAYVGKALVGSIDWRLPMQQAIDLPNLIARGRNFQGEVSRFSPEILAALNARGIDLRAGQGEDSGLHGIILRQGGWDGGADPRREGVVRLGPYQPLPQSTQIRPAAAAASARH
jgi:gamma-glutamyltranspeptidase / glutathione hydrolase